MGCTASSPRHSLHAPGDRSIYSGSEGSLTRMPDPRRWSGEDQPSDIGVRPSHNIPQRLLLTRCGVGQVVPIDMLPDDLLLQTFDFFMKELGLTKETKERWQTLVHVCRRWRRLVFGSPRRLHLELFCSNETPARDTLDAWPPLPLSIRCDEFAESVDNIVAVLERSDCVRHINLTVFEGLGRSTAMQVPFPELSFLVLRSIGMTVSTFPDSFLGGSVPRLEYLWLRRIPFPGLPKLLLSATRLTNLFLENIPHLGYFSPEALVTALSTLTRLEGLWLVFESPRPDPKHRHPPPPIRSALPNLDVFLFKGDGEYVEVVMTNIVAPRLRNLHITLFNDMIDTQQLTQFISRTPIMKVLEKAHVIFDGKAATVELSSLTSKYERLVVQIPCKELDQQVSSIEQVCTSCLPPLPALDLHIDGNPQGNVGNTPWLRLLHPFTSVRNLYLSEEMARRIVPALQELVGDRATEVLPTLENIFLEEGQRSGPVQEGIQQVVTVRQATNHPIVVSYQPKLLVRPTE